MWFVKTFYVIRKIKKCKAKLSLDVEVDKTKFHGFICCGYSYVWIFLGLRRPIGGVGL